MTITLGTPYTNSMNYKVWGLYLFAAGTLFTKMYFDAEAQAKAAKVSPIVATLTSRVYKIRNTGSKTTGTAFALKTGARQAYITNWHVCVGAANDTLLIETPQGYHPALVVKVSVKYDLCALRGLDIEHPLEMSSLFPVSTDIVHSAGFPHGKSGPVVSGFMLETTDVAAPYPPLPNGQGCHPDMTTEITTTIFRGMPRSVSQRCMHSVLVIDTDMPAAPGMSGSPVVDDTGRVVGVVAGVTEKVNAYFIPSYSLSTFIDGL